MKTLITLTAVDIDKIVLMHIAEIRKMKVSSLKISWSEDRLQTHIESFDDQEIAPGYDWSRISESESN